MFSSSSSDSEEELIVRRPRTYRERINLTLTITDFTFNQRFRVSKSTVEYLLQTIGGNLRHPTRRSHALNPKQQLLTVLRWLGSGS